MLQVETLRKPRHERKRRKSSIRSRSQTDTVRKRESSDGKFGSFEIISYAPQKTSSIVHLAISRSPSVDPVNGQSCMLNANSNHQLLYANVSHKAQRNNTASSSNLEFIRNSKLRTSPYRSKSMIAQEKEAIKTEKIFLSEKQSKNVKECGSFMPGAPPATPTPMLLKRIEYVPSMTDIRAQRSLQDRLQAMKNMQASRLEKQKREKERQERQTLAERSVEWKKSQRNIIYALNEIMTRAENSRFQDFINRNGLNV